MATRHGYIRDPAGMYRRSFETIREEADLSRFAGGDADIAVRLVHACGMIDLADDLVIAPGAVVAGRSAIDARRSIVCDVEMARHGIVRRLLPVDLPVVCAIGEAGTAASAETLGTTRAAAAFERLGGSIAGGIVAIGNAPTALFHLLEMIDRGLPPPALIVAMPVGFVGAAESKQALIDDPRGVAFVTVKGRRGGSALAAAAVNAIAGGSGE